LLGGSDFLGQEDIKEPLNHGEKRRNLFGCGQGVVLGLFEHLAHAASPFNRLPRVFI
jgi:hypothetical protein